MGLLDSAQSMLAGVLSLARTRLELFGTELQEELTRLFFALLCALIVLLLGSLAVVFGGLALLASLEPQYRAMAAGVLALLFLVLAIAALLSMRNLVRAKPRAFDASLAELERDYHALAPRSP
jgi:uncharacterized membrane protein YqjE